MRKALFIFLSSLCFPMNTWGTYAPKPGGGGAAEQMPAAAGG